VIPKITEIPQLSKAEEKHEALLGHLMLVAAKAPPLFLFLFSFFSYILLDIQFYLILIGLRGT
jgi:hypothetical protein